MKTILLLLALCAPASGLETNRNTILSIYKSPVVQATNVTSTLLEIATRSNNFVYATATNAILVSPAATVKYLRQEGMLTNVVNELLVTGEVCKVRGHEWTTPKVPRESVSTLEYYPDGRPAQPIRRECVLCKTNQTKREEWK